MSESYLDFIVLTKFKFHHPLMNTHNSIEMDKDLNEGDQNISNSNHHGNNEIQVEKVELSPIKNQITKYANDNKVGVDLPYNYTPLKNNDFYKNETSQVDPANLQNLSTGPGHYQEPNIFTPFSEEKNRVSTSYFHAFQSPFDGSSNMFPSNQEKNQSLFKSPYQDNSVDLQYNQLSPNLFSSKKFENGKFLNFDECLEKQQFEGEEKNKYNIPHLPHNKRKTKQEQYPIPHFISKPKSTNQPRANEEEK